jgi:hypothetical protein
MTISIDDTIVGRIERLEARAAIERLMADYAFGCDQKTHGASWASFTTTPNTSGRRAQLSVMKRSARRSDRSGRCCRRHITGSRM